VKVVNVLATVRTKAGEIVQDLTKEEFLLTESGRPQTIRYFSRDTNLPLVLGLLVDTSGSQRMVLGEEQEASFRFLETVLREDLDRTFLVHFDYRPEVLQNLTSSKAKLEQALELLSLPSQYRGAGGTTLYDAVYLCSNLITKKQTGRKALILLTDGEDTSSRTSLEERSIRWTRSTNSSRRNCAASTVWAIRLRIRQPRPSARLKSQRSAEG
jgi:VWFA-related protein